jgi:hypothetical protein
MTIIPVGKDLHVILQAGEHFHTEDLRRLEEEYPDYEELKICPHCLGYPRCLMPLPWVRQGRVISGVKWRK